MESDRLFLYQAAAWAESPRVTEAFSTKLSEMQIPFWSGYETGNVMN
jgi:hypothetical protein